MRKKMLAIMLCMALIVPTAACGSSTTAAQPAQEEKTEEEAEAEEEAPAEEPAAEETAAEETAEEEAVEITEADISGKLAALDETASGMTTFKEALPEASAEDTTANEELAAQLKINDTTQEVQASLATDKQALSYGGVIIQVPSSWAWEETQEGYLMTYPQDGHCFIVMNGTGVRGYDTTALMPALKDAFRSDGQKVSDYSAGGKSGIKSEYYSTLSGINVKVTDYYFLPNDTWLLQVKCVSTTTESFDSILQTIDFRYALTAN